MRTKCIFPKINMNLKKKFCFLTIYMYFKPYLESNTDYLKIKIKYKKSHIQIYFSLRVDKSILRIDLSFRVLFGKIFEFFLR